MDTATTPVHNQPLSASLLSPDQHAALDQIKDWLRAVLRGGQAYKRPQLTFGGYAGVGKTTLLRTILADQEWRQGAAVVSFTGKAVDVLRRKGLGWARTLHSFLYVPEKMPNGKMRYALKEPKLFERVRWVAVDEAQTLDCTLYNDLMSLGKPVLFVGDMGQLEPIGMNPRLMVDPAVTLTQVHRQAERSPIIRLSMSLRLGDGSFDDVPGEVETGNFDEMMNVVHAGRVDQVICGFNRTRHWVNQAVRDYRGYSGKGTLGNQPQPGERVICLQNNRGFNVFNGMMGRVRSAEQFGPLYMLAITTEDGVELPAIPADAAQFGSDKLETMDMNLGMTYWDFGYAVTTHKAMGSEWDRVAVREEIHPDWEWRRWTYTAATRAAKYLFYSQ